MNASYIDNLKRKLYIFLYRLHKNIKRITGKIILPGFKGLSLYNVGFFFVNGIINGALSMRASSVAFNLILSIFPALIFLFSLIPFIPIDNFHAELFNVLYDILPESVYNLLFDTINDIILNKRITTLSVSVILMLSFSSNGTMSLIDAFNATYYDFETRNGISTRITSIVLVLIIGFLFLLAIALITLGNKFFISIFQYYGVIDHSALLANLLFVVRWLLIIGLFFCAISFLYYLAPSRKARFKFISPGSIFATFILIVAGLGFSFYVNNFARYNKLYGSLGTIIVVMLLFYIISYTLILGFELNVSIIRGDRGRLREEERNNKIDEKVNRVNSEEEVIDS